MDRPGESTVPPVALAPELSAIAGVRCTRAPSPARAAGAFAPAWKERVAAAPVALNPCPRDADTGTVTLGRKAPVPRFVEKLRVPVRLALANASPLDGFVLLAPRSEIHDGPETLLETLNRTTRIVPVVDGPDGDVRLVTRAYLRWMQAGPDVASLLVRPKLWAATREERVHVRFAAGDSFDGVLAIEMPNDYNRASDFLNSDEAFFALTTATGTVLVNKSAVAEVVVSAGTRMALPRAAA